MRYVTQMSHSGHFEIIENGNVLAEGKISKCTESLSQVKNRENKKDDTVLKREDIYQELHILGYEYGPKFQNLKQFRMDGKYY